MMESRGELMDMDVNSLSLTGREGTGQVDVTFTATESNPSRENEGQANLAVTLVPVMSTDLVERQQQTRAVNPCHVDAAVSLIKRRLVSGHSSAIAEEGAESAILTEDAKINERKLFDLLSQTVANAQNNSALLLGPRGCGKTLVLERVLAEVQRKYPRLVSVVRLNGLLHGDERNALKEIAKQLCLDNELAYSKSSSFDDNLRFLMDMLKQCMLSHRTVIFILDEFDLFAQKSKQTLLYNLLDAMQSSEAQAAVLGLSCRVDADQLLEKRVRSRFSQRHLLFLPPPVEECFRILKEVLTLPSPPAFPYTAFASSFNSEIHNLLQQPTVQKLITQHCSVDLSPRHLYDLAFKAICNMDRTRGYPTVRDFQMASGSFCLQPKLVLLRDVSVLELYLLVAMKRLEVKEKESYNFHMVYAEYDHLQANHVHNSCDRYSRGVALRAFEHLLERELVTPADVRASVCDLMEFRPIKLLISHAELERGLKMHPTCPALLQTWFSHETVGHTRET
ncbi:hypothetical protein CBR_g38777 [Chara braunii]|uniref:Origin recognition complex subunit 4 n=1 Tax=Chara braunii TaxID=69332 RepID=A0A388LQ97_CHABU|nr:hypothetical protein CBR_g38777 [Chara braunii]|eukprot:GBG84494.1 hypothetical protein CBR_g38777 [Chara braunii]